MADPIRIDLGPARELGVNLDQYTGLWAVNDGRFLQVLQAVSSIDLRSHILAHRDRDVSQPKATEIVEAAGVGATKIAVIDIEGTLTKQGSSFSDAGSMVRIRQHVRAAANDPSVGGILLRIDSPGGTVSGTADLADEIVAARQKKPVHAFVEDMAASAAYWLCSQCDRVVANNRTAVVGSIGTFVGLYDLSGWAAKEGIKAIVVKSGSLKGAGFPGTEITEEQVATWQDLIDKTQAEFTAAVASGRGMSTDDVQAIADGRVHMAADAQAMGLIDGIESFEAAMANLAQAAMVTSQEKGPNMTTGTEKKAATSKELKAAFPKADATFLLDQLDRGATIDEARVAWAETLEARLEIRDEELAAARKSSKPAGVKPLKSKRRSEDMPPEDDEEELPVGEGEDATDEEDTPAAFWGAVARRQRSGMSRKAAISATVRENPRRHEAMVAAANRSRGRRSRA